nr:immunoglobulin light chain junction region [Macaca mulatta]MOW11080.1 immunoglobulin light chain junction region [Macaca mulatta]
CQQVYSIPPTF